jgi:aminopeptidase YwaD
MEQAGATDPGAAPAPEAAEAATFSGERALAHVRHLAGAIGPRPAGAPGAGEAAGYIAQTLAAYGYEVVRQPFTFPQFEERETSLQVGGAGMQASGAAELWTIPAHAMLYSASGTVQGALVFAGYGRADDFPPEGLGGAIAVMERGENITFREKAERAARAGAAAAVIYNNLPREFAGSLQVPSSIPVVAISGQDGQRLRALLEQGPVTGRMTVDASVETRATENVIATRVPAGRPAAPRIVLGAHYDSVAIGPGANDNASGTAVILELARVLAAEDTGVALSVIAFGAEELGLLGSAHYVAGLPAAERARIRAMLNFDMVGVGQQLMVGGDERIARLVEEAAGQRGLRIGRLGQGSAQRSDHAPFIAAGIPAVFFHVLDDPNYHTPSDVVEHVSAARLSEIGAIAADVIRRLAQGQ